jgi:hypothetical protein
VSNFIERLKIGWRMPVRLRIYRIVLYILAALSAKAGWLDGMIAVMFIVFLFQSEIFESAVRIAKESQPSSSKPSPAANVSVDSQPMKGHE